jgi:ABC-type amino acid transport system permease subunit
LWMIVSSPFLTLPHIVMGLFLGFIRINYGFFYSFLFHVTINFISSVPFIVELLIVL